MHIKTVAGDEIACIKSLWEKLNAHHLTRSNYFKGHFSTFTFERRLRNLQKHELLSAFVAEDDGENIGYCLATVDGSAGEIESLFVDEKHRGKKIGEQLVSVAMGWLKEHKCEIIRVSIAEGNEDVLDFYRKFGFAERLIVMQLTG